ncbi:MAG: methylated-DNA--[protein]-cysteine S-methyltransferase [Acidiferrobacterales bacterium]
MTKQLATNRNLVRGTQKTNSESFHTQSRDYSRIATALGYLAHHYTAQPELSELARHVGLSEYHLQRLFTRWVGVSPKKFLQYVTLEQTKRSLASAVSVLDASLAAGLSGPGRLHDLFVTCEAVTPGEYKLRGKGLTIRYGFHPSPFGECLLMLTDRGVCGLAFVADGERSEALAYQSRGWENARILHAQRETQQYIKHIFSPPKVPARKEPPLRLLVRGTPFQLKVWEALLKVPLGSLTTYDGLARGLGYRRGGNRAIGQAVGSNLIGYLIPCHRVIRKSGLIGGYRWGVERKLAILGWEAARAERLLGA